MNKLIVLVFLIVSKLTFGQVVESINNQDKKVVLEYFRSESVGGKLDFELKLKDDGKTFYMFDNIIYNKKDFAIFMWGQAIKQTEKFSKKEAIELWEEINQKDLTKPEKKALYRGFKTNLK